MFKTGSEKDWLKIHKTLHKIIKIQSLKTGPQMYAMTNNLLTEEALRVFEQNSKENLNETKENFKLVIEGLTIHLFPPKALQRQNSYLL